MICWWRGPEQEKSKDLQLFPNSAEQMRMMALNAGCAIGSETVKGVIPERKPRNAM